MYSIAICNSDRLDLSLLSQYVELWLNQHKEVDWKITTFLQVDELVEMIDKKKYFDLYLLDITLPDINGIELGRIIRKNNNDSPIIYITSYPDFALEAYEIHALRYITKPINTDELYSALDFAYMLFCNQPVNTILIKENDSLTSVVIDDIMYIENKIRSTTYTLNNNKQIISIRRTGSFEQALGHLLQIPYFIQTHKSFFINLKYVNALHSNAVTMDDDKKIPISRKHVSSVRTNYLNFISQKGHLV